ncbi:MAG: hypothetical protein MZU91_07940 [Desulfosudis oleivorans]|nr:hypothetical protein [Desulfosudis oleivorans]
MVLDIRDELSRHGRQGPVERRPGLQAVSDAGLGERGDRGRPVRTARLPEAQPFKVDFVDAPIMSFEGRTVMYLPVRLSLNASGGAVFVKVGVEYQACAPAYCLMPQRVVHTAELPVVPRDERISRGQPGAVQRI